MRKLASIQQIAEIRPIEGADRIVHYRVNDWWVVDGIDKYKVGDLVCYFEIDALCPITPEFEFLAARGTKKSELEDGTIVEGYRLRTIRLKKALSQGLLMGIEAFGFMSTYFNESNRWAAYWVDPDLEDPQWTDGTNYFIGDDVTELLGVHKYELPMNASLRGTARGNFPSFARRSDQERAQNLRRQIWDSYVAGDKFQVTVKLDGCVAEGTLISTGLGEVKIEDVCIGDMVKSYDIVNSRVVEYKVTGVLVRDNVDNWYNLTFSDGTELMVTANHPIWLPNLACYRRTDNLRIGDEIISIR